MSWLGNNLIGAASLPPRAPPPTNLQFLWSHPIPRSPSSPSSSSSPPPPRLLPTPGNDDNNKSGCQLSRRRVTLGGIKKKKSGHIEGKGVVLLRVWCSGIKTSNFPAHSPETTVVYLCEDTYYKCSLSPKKKSIFMGTQKGELPGYSSRFLTVNKGETSYLLMTILWILGFYWPPWKKKAIS